MRVRNNVFYSLLLMLADLLVLAVAFIVAYIIRVQFDTRPLVSQVAATDYFLTFLAIAPFWIITLGALGLYDRNIRNKRTNETLKLLVGSFIGILLIIGYEFASGQPVFPARLVAVYAFVGSFLLLVIVRFLIHTLRGILFRNGIGAHRLLIIGANDTAHDIVKQLSQTSKSGYHISALAGPKKFIPSDLDIAHYNSIERALGVIKPLHITAIIQTDLYGDDSKNQAILRTAQTHHIDYNFIPGKSEFYSGKNTVDLFLGYPMISVSQTALIGWGEIVKQVFDLVITIPLLIILSPILLVIYILQKIFNPGPALYKSARLSRYSEKFTLLKFRSMNPKYGKRDAAVEFRAMGREDLAKEYELHRKVKNDPRITGFGKFLRRTSLDELPQFFNVLKGDLSLVGPRPILPQEMKLTRGRGALLHSVKSGVTGLWQVSGRSDLSFEQRIELETYYAQNWSFWLDIKILLKTFWVVVRKNGAK
ncbi:UDP-phosphate galactose phosphotransferase [Candidatus Saccharibacteria bacterium RIFCSPHIGHO2_12_FULL_42_8]|nr:MAG: UDP-phosphate galactose phosphotransferase [Candidatus Saccharibacteria bacterium RIFCSPHIGHO2_12_FULL_42_8]